MDAYMGVDWLDFDAGERVASIADPAEAYRAALRDVKAILREQMGKT